MLSLAPTLERLATSPIQKSNNNYHSMTYGVDLRNFFFGKIQKSDLQEPPKFKQFLTIFSLFFQILLIFFVTNHYNTVWSTKFVYGNKNFQKIVCQISIKP